jgi:DNA helicase II / ATP-dependent DNA helicase PcrA
MIDINDSRFSKILGEGNKPSKAQLDIVDFVAHKIGNATVQSRAGSGKSKTIELAVSFVPSKKKVLVVSYNRHIARNLKEKFGDLQNVDVLTYHGLGLKILGTKFHRKFDEKNINEYKYKEYITQHIEELCHDCWKSLNGVERCCYKKNIEKLVEYARYNKAQSEKEIATVAAKYGIAPVCNEIESVRKILKWGSSNLEIIDYTDMVWLPYELLITANMPNLQYDMIFIDEAQDSSLIQQNLINICKKRNTRFIAFGDAKQCINAWCGSDEHAFANFGKQANTTTFHLNVSFRCSKSVVELVQKLVPDFEEAPNAKEGNVQHNATLKNVQNGDLILCRRTSPLVKLHMQLLKQGKPSRINGLELSKEISGTIRDTGKENISEAIDVLYGRLFKIWESLKEEYSCSLKEVVTEDSIINLYDEIQSIIAVSEGLTKSSDVIQRLGKIFINDSSQYGGGAIKDIIDETHIHLSTVHRAKGLEANNVYIICPSLMPSKLAKSDWEIEAEDNLIYVAWSRAKDNLYFVDEKEVPTERSFSGTNELYNELIELKNKYDAQHKG